MSQNPVVTILKRLAGIRPDDVKAASDALEGINSELKLARAEFSAASAEFGARLVAALAEGSASAVEADLDAKRIQVARLERAREAVATRLQAAQDAASAAELDKRWDVADRALRAHRLALVRFERAAKDLAAAMLAAEAASVAAYQSLPVRDGIRPFMTDLAGELQRQLALSTEGRHGGFAVSFLPELRAHPSLVMRAEQVAAHWLSKRPPLTQATPPEAA